MKSNSKTIEQIKDQIIKAEAMLAEMQQDDVFRSCWVHRLEDLQADLAELKAKRMVHLQHGISSLEREIKNGFFKNENDRILKIKMLETLHVDMAMLEFS